MSREEIHVGVIGPGDASPQEKTVAEYIGRRLAEMGWRTVCGGLGGVMEAACRGADAAGGITIGLLPGQSREEGNRYLTVSIPTGMGELRNGLVVRASDALVAVGGSWGTLSEVSLGVKSGKIVVGLGTWEAKDRGRLVAGVLHVSDPDEAVGTLTSYFASPEFRMTRP